MNDILLARTRPAVPSLLGNFTICPARYLLESESHTFERLPLHPGVILGHVVHQLANSVQHRTAMTGGYSIRHLENNFAATLAATRRIGPVTDWIYKHHGITGLVSRKTLVTQIRYTRTLIPPIARSVMPEREKTLPVGREIKLTSCQFDMQGRADLIYQDASNLLKIFDFKTGNVTDEQNQPKEAYLLQIAAYGMMVKELVPEMSIGLVLTGVSDSWTGMLDKHLTEWATSIIENLNELLQRNIPLSVYGLARPGMHCSGCSSRCSCPVYVEKLREQMQLFCVDRQYGGRDIYGHLLEVESESNLLTLKVLLEDGSVVKVFRMPASAIHEPTKITGKKIALYGLKTFNELSAGRFPRNFYVIDVQDTRRSAFQFYCQCEEIN
ncbi:PD-(D/E)XK nuclease family protein [Xenorhabdus bovienii]|uniref:PD-(D/E)XK nuclease family protein n=1 Tax=Xenorhabdus bovienii TaxID=40576 RepID=UPI002157EB87|nr:PD-(D/E)XK nuclease family protein [Xenorhabdus bovienii]